MKLSNRIALSGATALSLGLFSAYGWAQPKPAAPPPKPMHAHVHAADAGAQGMACDAGPCTHMHGMHEGMQCPMTQLAALAEVKVEKTKAGATLQLTAKDASKAAEVQALAEKMAEHMKAGGCPMAAGHAGAPHGHEHHHGGPGAPPARPAK